MRFQVCRGATAVSVPKSRCPAYRRASTAEGQSRIPDAMVMRDDSPPCISIHFRTPPLRAREHIRSGRFMANLHPRRVVSAIPIDTASPELY